MAPEPLEKRRGVYEYIVEAPVVVVKPKAVRGEPRTTTRSDAPPERGSFTRATPEEMGAVIRRLPSR